MAPSTSHLPAAPDLTPDETTLLRLIAANQPNAELARAIGISRTYVTREVGLLMAKLGCATRPQAIALAALHGIVDRSHITARCQAAAVRLTKRELDVLRGWAGGRSNQELADELHVKVESMRGYAPSILNKFGVSSQEQACGLGVLTGLVRPSDIDPALPASLPGNRAPDSPSPVQQPSLETQFHEKQSRG
ncbi:response regulator transcription factor [Kitasatospora sp. HPMI-4]|uniref:response regulator transcription factor n=1 Tax=Kitasatospora sp. HPMI-4 TaxID=3448443 RepID=UPI003F1CD653